MVSSEAIKCIIFQEGSKKSFHYPLQPFFNKTSQIETNIETIYVLCAKRIVYDLSTMLKNKINLL